MCGTKHEQQASVSFLEVSRYINRIPYVRDNIIYRILIASNSQSFLNLLNRYRWSMNEKSTAKRAYREKINRRKYETEMMRHHRKSERERVRNCEYENGNGDDDDDHNDDTK